MMKRFLLVGLALLAPLWAFAQCTECASSAGSVEITVDATKVDAAIIFGYIPMSRLPTGIHDAMAADGDTTGATLRMETADGTAECAIWVPTYVGASDTGALIWRLTGLSASVDTVYRLHHVPGATMYSTSATYGRNAVFSGYAGAWMPGVTTDGLTGSYNLTGVNTPGTGAWVEGLLAATFNGTNQYYYFSGTQGATAWPMSIKGVILTDVTGGTRTAVHLGVFASTSNVLSIWKNTTGVGQAGVQGNAGSAATAATGTMSTATYYRVATTRDSASSPGDTYGYFDGTQYTNATNINAFGTADRISIGAGFGSSAHSSYWKGNVGFAGIMASVDSADVATTEHNMWTDSAFYSVGAWVPNASDPGKNSRGFLSF